MRAFAPKVSAFAPLLCALFWLAAPAHAQNFDVVLGNKTLGQMTFDPRGSLRSTLDNTPLGVFNGTFQSTLQTSANGTETFTGVSQSSRKSRKVVVEFTQGRTTGINITPDKERTALSDITRVPAGVIDPVTAVGKLIHAKGCPAPLHIYEGRRVIALLPQAAQQNGTQLVCPVSYNVIAGPGHLSPLRISSAKMTLTYAVSGKRQTLRQIALTAGIFTVSLNRTD